MHLRKMPQKHNLTVLLPFGYWHGLNQLGRKPIVSTISKLGNSLAAYARIGHATYCRTLRIRTIHNTIIDGEFFMFGVIILHKSNRCLPKNPN